MLVTSRTKLYPVGDHACVRQARMIPEPNTILSLYSHPHVPFTLPHTPTYLYIYMSDVNRLPLAGISGSGDLRLVVSVCSLELQWRRGSPSGY